jgi:hypothetical protein
MEKHNEKKLKLDRPEEADVIIHKINFESLNKMDSTSSWISKLFNKWNQQSSVTDIIRRREKSENIMNASSDRKMRVLAESEDIILVWQKKK